MNGNKGLLEKLQREFAKFERTMEELYFLKCVTEDLKSVREMIKFTKYD